MSKEGTFRFIPKVVSICWSHSIKVNATFVIIFNVTRELKWKIICWDGVITRLFVFPQRSCQFGSCFMSAGTLLKSSFFIERKIHFVVNQRLWSSHDTSQIPRWLLRSDVYKKFHSAVFSLAFYYVCYATTWFLCCHIAASFGETTYRAREKGQRIGKVF